jgi:ribosomal protein S18 acetylase RimI-like enzyme
MLTTRLANESDIENLFVLNELFNGENCTTKDLLKKSIVTNEQEIVCITYDGEIAIGFCCGQIFKSMCYSSYYGEITELFVEEKYRRQGVAKSLMEFLESMFISRKIKSFQLFTDEDNKTAQVFYEALGYKKSPELQYRKRI